MVINVLWIPKISLTSIINERRKMISGNELLAFTMPEDEPFVCSYSGGKDSAIALGIASDIGKANGIIHWFDEDKNQSVFHSQDLSLIEAQAESMGLPLTITHYTPWNHRIELINIYKEFKEQGIKSIVFGDIYLEDSVKIQSILCKKAGLQPRYPLWKKDYSILLQEIEKRNIKAIISRVNTSYLDENWLGKLYTIDLFEQFKKMGIDPFGECGEFHTTVVYSNNFKKPLLDELCNTRNLEHKMGISLTSHHRKNNVYRLLDTDSTIN